MKNFLSQTYPPCIICSVADAGVLRSLLFSDSVPDCDMLELRVDGLLNSGMALEELETIRLSLPILLTVRTPEEGVHLWICLQSQHQPCLISLGSFPSSNMYQIPTMCQALYQAQGI